MKYLKRKYWAMVFAIMVALGMMSSCGTQTHEEIKTINGIQFLCTWTNYPTSPWTKEDYRCINTNGMNQP